MTAPNQCPRCGSALEEGEGTPTLRALCPRCMIAGSLGLEGSALLEPADDDRGRELPPAPGIDELVPHFPQLAIDALIARGGMGAVYKATQKHLERSVALKVLDPAIASRPGFSERFAREAKALAQLAHPGIVSVHEYGQAGPWFYFVMEYVDGTSLREVIRARTSAPREALSIVMQVCDALQFAHDHGVVHRDIKPENVLVTRRGQVKILDFGLAKVVGRGDALLTRTSQVMGTPHYMAPEQWERPLEVDHRADIYALGVVFYELLTNELPLGRFAPPSQRVRIDVRLDGVVLRTLEKEPELRYQHASEVKSDVERIRDDPAPAVPAPPPPVPTGPDVRSSARVAVDRSGHERDERPIGRRFLPDQPDSLESFLRGVPLALRVLFALYLLTAAVAAVVAILFLANNPL